MSAEKTTLTSTVPVLNGLNYQTWEPLMRAYLQGNDVWFAIVGDVITLQYPGKTITRKLADGTEESKVVPDDTKTPVNIDEFKVWAKENYKALGKINLRLHESIRYKYSSIEIAKHLWEKLKDGFGKPGIPATYHEFKGALSTNLPENANPSTALNKLQGHFGRMADAECSIPEHLKCLIILAKLPSTMDNLAQMICQADDVSDLSIEKIQRQIQVAWEQRAGARDFQRGNQQGRGSANKLSAVKRPQGNPSFQQQLNNQSAGPSLQERLEGNKNRGRGRGRGKPCGRGNCGGQRKNQANQAQDDDDLQSHVSFPQDPKEKYEFSEIACSMISRPPPPPPQAFRPPWFHPVSSIPSYPDFAAAHALSKEMGLTPTTQTVKRLEMEHTADPRPNKRQRVINEDEVDIWGSDYGDDIVMDNEAGPSNTERLVTISPANNSADDFHLAFKAEQTSSPPSFTTSVQKGRREQSSLLYEPLCMNVSEIEDTTEWTLDSGASRHFTHDINDFVEYRLIKPWGIKTATSRTTVIAKGTICQGRPQA